MNQFDFDDVSSSIARRVFFDLGFGFGVEDADHALAELGGGDALGGDADARFLFFAQRRAEGDHRGDAVLGGGGRALDDVEELLARDADRAERARGAFAEAA